MKDNGDFWTRRRAKVLAETEAEVRFTEAQELAEIEHRRADTPDEELLEELGLPDPDTLQPGDDFRAFMAKAVPDRLRRRALRRLWLSNPALANLDGLLDYGEDFTDSAKVIENMQTAYQIGKGMTRHVEEMIRQAAEEETPDRIEDDDTAPEPPVEEPVVVMAEPQPLAAETDPHETDEALAPRRRMQFTFDDHAGGTA